MSNRRAFITLLGGATIAWPLAARAQQATMPVIGYLHVGSLGDRRFQVAAFQRGLSELGFVEGRNITIEYRWADGQYNRLADLVADLIRRRVAVIAAPAGAATALAAKSLTSTIPIVFSTSVDPVLNGLVASLNRPGGNITGITDMGREVGAKQLGLLHELLPSAARFAVLVDPKPPALKRSLRTCRRQRQRLGNQSKSLLPVPTSTLIPLESIAEKRADALVVASQAFFLTRRVQPLTLTARHALPTIYSQREFVEAGGLMSYGSSLTDRDRQLGIYTGRVLKGEKPADLPILQATKFEFVINLQTAKTIGLTVPPTLLATADEVIE
jgi:putative ABC transport system substrate-binding protein